MDYNTQNLDSAAQAADRKLQVEGSRVTGTAKDGNDNPESIFEGSVAGYLLTFTTNALLNGGPVTIIWTGHLEDDGFTMTRAIQMPDGSIRNLPNVFRFRRNGWSIFRSSVKSRTSNQWLLVVASMSVCAELHWYELFG